jgi:hypothetical protein
MPLLLHQEEVKLEFSDIQRRIVLPRDVDSNGFILPPQRTSGLHLSGLLKYIAKTSRLSHWIKETEEDYHPLRWMLGNAFEEYAASLLPFMVWQPGEAVDPVIMTPDGVTWRDDLPHSKFCVNEFKFNRAKRYSADDLVDKKWAWMCQGKGYCLGYGTRYVEWNVMSCMEWPDPVWSRYLIEFSEKELKDMRLMIEANREGAEKAGFAE